MAEMDRKAFLAAMVDLLSNRSVCNRLQPPEVYRRFYSLIGMAQFFLSISSLDLTGNLYYEDEDNALLKCS